MKTRVAVLYGGRSGEHEVSLQSAASVIRNLDPQKFEVIPIAIDKEGRWLLNDLRLIEESKTKALPVFKDAPPVVLPPNPAVGGSSLLPLSSRGKAQGIDVVFPVMHGPLCEDGTIQGLLELADVPYVGSGVLGSSVSMDKEVAKRLARDAGLPIVPFICLRAGSWNEKLPQIQKQISSSFGYPVFVKPANLGSSVGVAKVKKEQDLKAALDDAFRYDTKVLIEQAIAAREIELAILENSKVGEPPLVSVAGEINPTHEFYSYSAKYLDENGASLMIPAKLDAKQNAIAQKLGQDLFQTLECEGMARVDLFLDKNSGAFYFNEVNTIPGFTQISMYPKLWEASGISYRDLLTRLIELAIQRHERKRGLTRSFEAS
jgi:D-alanine-D-alanine ligase